MMDSDEILYRGVYTKTWYTNVIFFISVQYINPILHEPQIEYTDFIKKMRQ
jgi:hypothetical protein